MRINVMEVLKRPDGEPFIEHLPNEDGAPCGECGQLPLEASPVKLRTACVTALLTPDTEVKSAEAKIARYRLATRLCEAETPELSPEELVLIRKAVNAAYPSPAVVGAAFSLLDGTKEPDNTKAE